MSMRALGHQFKEHMLDKAETYYMKAAQPLVDHISRSVERDMPEINTHLARWDAAFAAAQKPK